MSGYTSHRRKVIDVGEAEGTETSGELMGDDLHQISSEASELRKYVP